jgi:hypothetical protein
VNGTDKSDLNCTILIGNPLFMGIDRDFVGRWDMVIHHEECEFPSWFELDADGKGQFVGQFGSARPIEHAASEDGLLTFSMPKQYEPRTDDMEFRGCMEGEILRGTTTHHDGSGMRWSAFRAPELPYRDVTWASPSNLFAGGLSNWEARSPEMPFHWSIADGMLVNAQAGSDLVHKHAYSDIRLIAEYKYPAGSNSGIYLRGRYEFQIVDDFGKEPSWGSSGAIYGFLVPSANAINAAGEWNRVEIEIVGRWVTVDLNGMRIIDRREIPGITGGALDSNEGKPGTLFIQGDHGPVTFRRLDLSEAG